MESETEQMGMEMQMEEEPEQTQILVVGLSMCHYVNLSWAGRAINR